MLADLGLLMVRLVVGALFIGHGLQKLAGWFGGLLFGLGLFNPLGTVFICAVMLMAIARVHWPKGLWVTNGGFEYPLTIIALTVAVALAGPGGYALARY